MRNQQKGLYDRKVTDIKVRNKIVGLHAIVVERVYLEKEGDTIKEGESRMTLFEFKKEKCLESLNIGSYIKTVLKKVSKMNIMNYD